MTVALTQRTRMVATQGLPDHMLIFGLDANTYTKGSAKLQGAASFMSDVVAKGLSSCWGDEVDSQYHCTTCLARTYLQPQLQKAVRSDQKITQGDHNPKDFILFKKADFELSSCTKDNTGRREFVELMMFPTLEWPSDHGLVAATLTPFSSKAVDKWSRLCT